MTYQPKYYIIWSKITLVAAIDDFKKFEEDYCVRHIEKNSNWYWNSYKNDTDRNYYIYYGPEECEYKLIEKIISKYKTEDFIITYKEMLIKEIIK